MVVYVILGDNRSCWTNQCFTFQCSGRNRNIGGIANKICSCTRLVGLISKLSVIHFISHKYTNLNRTTLRMFWIFLFNKNTWAKIQNSIKNYLNPSADNCCPMIQEKGLKKGSQCPQSTVSIMHTKNIKTFFPKQHTKQIAGVWSNLNCFAFCTNKSQQISNYR